MQKKNILITGAARRIGAACTRLLHSQGYNLILHYNRSATQAQTLCNELNNLRTDSACIIQADLQDLEAVERLAKEAITHWGGVNALINNASTFYPQVVGEVGEAGWNELVDSNLKAPFFLSQALMTTLDERRGCIVNIIDIHAERGLKDHPVYSIAKAGLAAMTRVLAKELAPNIRVNGVSPGAILWPEEELSESAKKEILERIALKRTGEPGDIAKAVAFLINDAPYVSGQNISVDGGRTLFC